MIKPGNKKLCERIAAALLASGPLRIFTNARACFLVQKLFSYCYLLPDGLQTELLNIVRDNFTRLAVDQYGYHTVQAAVSNLGPQHTADLLIRLENPSTLLSLVKNKFGTFVAQACLPLLERRTVTALVNR